LGGGKRVRSPGSVGAFTWVEPVNAGISSDIKKGSRLIIESADDDLEKIKLKNLYQTGLAPVKQTASISDNKLKILD